MRHRARLAALALCVLAAQPGAARASDPPRVPAQLSATVVIEPPRIEVGDAFDVEIAVVTPAEHRVPVAPVPKTIDGLWILSAEQPVVERAAGRWIHRQRVRVRARDVGDYQWPALELTVTGPHDEERHVTVPARPFAVVSLLDEAPDRTRPFSYREPAPTGGDRRAPWLPALVGALFALGAVALVAAVRRARAAPSRFTPGGVLPAPSGLTAQTLERLRRARASAHDPVHAADLASLALREWAAERGRAPELLRATVEELAARAAPPALVGRYEGFVGLVAELDALRFPAAGADAEARTREVIGRTLAWVAGVGAAP